MAEVARSLGVPDPPQDEASLRARLESYRGELRSTAQSRAAARFLLLNPPVSLFLRPAYGVLSAAAVELMPRWARARLRLPYVPVVEPTVVRTAGQLLTSGLRFVMKG
jgi:uncharacterized protein (DUF2236 family)